MRPRGLSSTLPKKISWNFSVVVTSSTLSKKEPMSADRRLVVDFLNVIEFLCQSQLEFDLI